MKFEFIDWIKHDKKPISDSKNGLEIVRFYKLLRLIEVPDTKFKSNVDYDRDINETSKI